MIKPGNLAGQSWARRTVQSFGCPRTPGFLAEVTMSFMVITIAIMTMMMMMMMMNIMMMTCGS